MNENGVLDFMLTLESSGDTAEESSKRYHSRILQNDLNFDTAFVKVAVLSGLQSMPAAYGANQIGAFFYSFIRFGNGILYCLDSG